jgi:hypothetical protein
MLLELQERLIECVRPTIGLADVDWYCLADHRGTVTGLMKRCERELFDPSANL